MGGVNLHPRLHKNSKRWHMRYTDSNGKQQEFTTKKVRYEDAIREAERILPSKVNGVRPKTKITLAELFEAWSRAMLARNQKATYTVRTDYSRIRIILRWAASLNLTYADRLTQQDGEDLKEYLLRDHAPKTVQNYLSVLKAAYAWAHKNESISVNPMAKLKLIPRRNVESARKFVDTYTDEEVERILAAAEGSPYYDMILTIAYTGLRRGEMMALNVGDVVETEGRLLIQVQGGKSVDPRAIAVHSRLAPIIRKRTAKRGPQEPLFIQASTGGPPRAGFVCCAHAPYRGPRQSTTHEKSPARITAHIRNALRARGRTYAHDCKAHGASGNQDNHAIRARERR